MKHRLPMLEERGIAEAALLRLEQTKTFERDLLTRTPVTCHKGCHHCCQHPVMMSILEGISLQRWLADHRMWSTALKAKFEAHHAKVYGLELGLWLISEIPCPLLEASKGVCTAYEGRPSSCRLTFSTGDAYLCHPHRLVDAQSIVPRREAIGQIVDQESKILKRTKQKLAYLPLSTAVLIGERINNGDLSLRDYAQEVLRMDLDRGT